MNSYHTNHKQLAQLMTTYIDNDGSKGTGPAVAMPVGQELRTKYGSDFKNVSMASWNFGHVLAVGEKKITGEGMWVESNFPSMFSIKMIKGNRNALNDPSSVLISTSIAKALFGDADAINKTIKFDNRFDFKVAGVFEDFPHNTTLYDSKLLLPWKKYITTEEWLKNAATQWNNHSWQAFVQVADNADIAKVSDKIKMASMVHKDAKTEGKEELVLQPMDKWRIQFVWLFAVIGVFVLLLACINFMNLSTARSEKRAK